MKMQSLCFLGLLLMFMSASLALLHTTRCIKLDRIKSLEWSNISEVIKQEYLLFKALFAGITLLQIYAEATPYNKEKEDECFLSSPVL